MNFRVFFFFPHGGNPNPSEVNGSFTIVFALFTSLILSGVTGAQSIPVVGCSEV